MDGAQRSELTSGLGILLKMMGSQNKLVLEVSQPRNGPGSGSSVLCSTLIACKKDLLLQFLLGNGNHFLALFYIDSL